MAATQFGGAVSPTGASPTPHSDGHIHNLRTRHPDVPSMRATTTRGLEGGGPRSSSSSSSRMRVAGRTRAGRTFSQPLSSPSLSDGAADGRLPSRLDAPWPDDQQCGAGLLKEDEAAAPARTLRRATEPQSHRSFARRYACLACTSNPGTGKGLASQPSQLRSGGRCSQ